MSDDSSIDLDEVSTSGGETDQDKAPSPEKDVVLVYCFLIVIFVIM